MTGLNLEPFLRLLQADVGAWATLAAVVFLLGLVVWTGWGARRVLRKCLVLSVLAHVGLVFYGGEELSRLIAPGASDGTLVEEPGIREIRVAMPDGSPIGSPASVGEGRDGRSGGLEPDRDLSTIALASLVDPIGRSAVRPVPLPDDLPDVPLRDRIEAPDLTVSELVPEPSFDLDPIERDRLVEPEPEAADSVAPSAIDLAEEAPASREIRPVERPSRDALVLPDPDRLASRPDPRGRSSEAPGLPDRPGFASALPEFELPAPALDRSGTELADRGGLGPRPEPGGGELPSPSEASGVDGSDPGLGRRPAPPRPAERPLELPEADLRVASRPLAEPAPERRADRALPVPEFDLNRLAPDRLPNLPELRGGAGEARALEEVPEVYRPRLDPNRPMIARRAGASAESEEAVELALDWLARHQDADGRWNAGTARFRDGSAAPGEASFTSHCPPGDICHGECFYWEADTAVTGLALLAFLGSGYTHLEGNYEAVVGKGIEFLIGQQKADGDLRGESRAVGMYCHAMATLALCEAFALSGDPALRGPAERAVGFLVEAQYPGLMGWRYAPRSEITRKPGEGGGYEYDPHPPIGDTSVLGWVVMVLKSASEVGFEVPSNAVQSARNWLSRVSDGDANGLARYQPSRPSDPVMTAEAWVCRQFLGFGGPGRSSDEAAAFLLRTPPTDNSVNVYYWYYATLAMYQHGGPEWRRWNVTVRDSLVRLQRRTGHKAGSWDPDPTRYGTHGGRVYATALSAMTLEVYYRYLRLYSTEGGAVTGSGPVGNSDEAVRRAGGAEPR